MTTIRSDVLHNLKTITDNVKMSRPAGRPVLPLITYEERSNVSVNIAYSRHRYRITAYASNFEELSTLCNNIDNVIGHALGMERVSKSADGDARIATDMYMCKMEYTCLVNNIYNYIVRNAQ